MKRTRVLLSIILSVVFLATPVFTQKDKDGKGRDADREKKTTESCPKDPKEPGKGDGGGCKPERRRDP
jgi:hypothetical protein